MGCGSSKHSSALDPKLKGTALVAFSYNGGIIVAAESRGSSEDKPDCPLAIRDNINKMVAVSSKIIYVVQGSYDDCVEMNEHVRQKLGIIDGYVYARNAPTISTLVETMHEYMKSLHDKKKVCGAIIAGLDASGRPQIHRIFIKDGEVVKDKPRTEIAALGSGQTYARSVIEAGHNYNMSFAAAMDLARKALYSATYRNKHCGGEVRVYQITEKHGWEERPIMNAMETSVKYYEDSKHDEEKTLLLAVDATMGPISAKDLVQHFWSRPTLFAAHLVALCVLGDDRFYFHRLVFESKREAVRAYEKTSAHGRTSPAYLPWFPNQAVLDHKPSVAVYVDWSSERLIKFIQDQCQVQYM